jgi:putative ABC transport system permease protein
MTIHLRAALDPRSLVEPVRRALQAVNVDLPALQPRTLADHISASTFVPRTGTIVVGAFASLSLVLSVVGLYGVLAFSVALRAREMAIRVALGARRRSIAWSVAARALAIIGGGVAAGGVLAILCGELLRAKISSIAAPDPVMGLVVALVLVAAAAVATWVPARQATRVDPASVLRGD